MHSWLGLSGWSVTVHKGRSWCYDAIYWGPAAWFWPAYFPWKYKLEVLGSPPPPWNIFTFSDRVSFPAIWSADRQTVRYIFTTTSDPAHLELRMYKTTTPNTQRGVWQMLLTQGVIRWGDYRHLEEGPIRHLDNTIWDLDFNPIPYQTQLGPPYLVRPAVWSESGQHPPWH